MKVQAFEAVSLTESIIAFNQFLRKHDFVTGIGENFSALEASNLMITNKEHLSYALKSIFSNSPEERIRFEKLFSLFWETNPIDLDTKEQKNQTTVTGDIKNSKSSLIMMGKGNNKEGDEKEVKSVTGANTSERLMKTDFSKVEEIDEAYLDEIAKKIFKEMALKIKRRRKRNSKKGTLNIRNTIRKNLHYGGMCLNLAKKEKNFKKNRLILFLDISGSMDKYSFFLLKFMIILKEYFRQCECFVFSTSLLRITKILNLTHLKYTLEILSAQAKIWSGGTKIGDCFQEFNNKFGKLMLNGMPLVIILSDGLDTSETSILESQLKIIKSKSKKVVWLNPLKGSSNYQPLQKGMKAALPMIDVFQSAHNLKSLTELEDLLSSV